MASLTKIMTCLVVCQRIERNLLDPNLIVTINSRASSMVGTSSSLRIGDRLKVIDLLYGMMLPSGNDAAFALAEVIGRESFFKSVEYRNLILENSYYVKKCKPEVAVRYFLRIMNKLAKKLNLKNAYFSNPHGLSKKTNQISTDDMCILVDFAVT